MIPAALERRRVADVDPADRIAWLAWRKRGIGASDLPAILGESPYRTALDVYHEKLGEGRESPESLAMFLGKQAEPWIAEEYEHQTGRQLIAEQLCLFHPERPYLTATLDALRDDSRPVEMKLMLGRSTREIGDEGTDEMPAHWIIQAQAQAIVADAGEVDFAIASPQWDGLRVRTVERDEPLCRFILDKAAEFHDRVLGRTPPPVAKLADLRYVPLLQAEGREVAFDEGAAEAWSLYKSLGEEVSDLQKQRDVARLRVHQALGEASVGLLPCGGRILRKTIAPRPYTAAPRPYSTLTFKPGDR